MPSLLNLGGVCVRISTSSLISALASRRRGLFKTSFGPLAFSRASHADLTSNFAVRRALQRQRQVPQHEYEGLTSVDQCYSVVDGFLRVCFEDLTHVWEWRPPFQRVTKVAMGAHRAQEATRLRNLWMQGFAYFVSQQCRGRNRRIMTSGDDLSP